MIKLLIGVAGAVFLTKKVLSKIGESKCSKCKSENVEHHSEKNKEVISDYVICNNCEHKELLNEE